jgi:uncharacterized protein with PQ loop repeat
MVVNAAAENVLGTMGTICWSGQIIPQLYKNYKEKSTEGLSPWLMLIWSASGVPLGVYVIVQNINIPIILQPQLFGFLAAISWIQCLYYGNRKSRTFCTVIFTSYLLVYGGLVAGLSILTWHVKERGNEALLRFFGIFSSILIASGLIPQYIEIYQRKEVIGISLTFMLVDILGGVFSTLSLAFKPKLDVIAMITYLAVVVMDGAIVIAAFILNPRARRRRRHEQQQQQQPEMHETTSQTISSLEKHASNDLETGQHHSDSDSESHTPPHTPDIKTPVYDAHSHEKEKVEIHTEVRQIYPSQTHHQGQQPLSKPGVARAENSDMAVGEVVMTSHVANPVPSGNATGRSVVPTILKHGHGAPTSSLTSTNDLVEKGHDDVALSETTSTLES